MDHAVLLPRGSQDPRGLGCSPFARHYWGNHCCFLFLRVLRCFSSPGWHPHPIRRGRRACARRVVPFGNPGVKGRLRLTRDYRSLPRPSSPPRAKASAVRPYTLLMPGTRQPKRREVPYTSAFSPLLGYGHAMRRHGPSAYADLRLYGGNRCLINLLVFNYCHSMS